MNMNNFSIEQRENRLDGLRKQWIAVKASRHMKPEIKVAKLQSIKRKGKAHATLLAKQYRALDREVLAFCMETDGV